MPDRARYASFFITLAALSAYACQDSADPSRWLLLWPMASGLLLAIAYAGNRPGLVCGKTGTGRVSIPLLLINLPWLLFTWLGWIALALLSREHRISPIAGGRVWISRYPMLGVDLSQFDLVLDLTAEFPRFYRVPGRYIALPNLDGIELRNPPAGLDLANARTILVHCAQGHGRSATFATLLLARTTASATPAEAYAAIRAARPGAGLSPSQRRQLQNPLPGRTESASSPADSL